jgi:Holliday junction DNA helicase RuvA
MAERIIAKLRRRMTRFALMIASRLRKKPIRSRTWFRRRTRPLLSVGHSPQDARERIETVVQPGRKFKSVEDILTEIYQKQRR